MTPPLAPGSVGPIGPIGPNAPPVPLTDLPLPRAPFPLPLLDGPPILALTKVAAGTILPPEAIPSAIVLATEPLDVRYVDGHNWILLAPFVFLSHVLGRLLTVPVGFTTDFASTPRFLWGVLPPTGPYGKAAVGHDYLYRTPGLCTRSQADGVFKEMMISLGVPVAVRMTMWLGVRAFGQHNYKGGL